MDEATVASGEIPHFYDYLQRKAHRAVHIAIPSFDRPQKLCESTLPFLRRQGVKLSCVHVFVGPTPAGKATSPEWHRYLRTVREHGFTDIHVEPGGDGVWAQMRSIFQWAENGSHVIVMMDDVDDVVEKKTNKFGACIQTITNRNIVSLIPACVGPDACWKLLRLVSERFTQSHEHENKCHL